MTTIATVLAVLVATSVPALADTHVHINLMAGPGVVKSSLPPATRADLPSADNIRGRIKFLIGDNITAAVRVCVAASGTVTNLALVHGSSFAQFDQAVMTDARAWKFQPKAGAAKACELVSVTYHPM